MERTELIKEICRLKQHEEGGHYSESYTSIDSVGCRPIAGSIYFLLNEDEISHFHEIDCDEIWYFHEGCGMKITVLINGRKEVYLLGNDFSRGQRAMAVIPKGCIFGAENLDPKGYTFVSCVTAPKFRYEGFRLVGKDEIRSCFADLYDSVSYLAY